MESSRVEFREALRDAAGGFARSLAVEGPAFAAVSKHIEAETTEEEREAYTAAHRLGGPKAMCALLAERFGPGYAWVPFRYVRLRPPRQKYVMLSFNVTFLSEAGWHQVPVALAQECARANEDAGTSVFDLSDERPSGRVVELGAPRGA